MMNFLGFFYILNLLSKSFGSTADHTVHMHSKRTFGKEKAKSHYTLLRLPSTYF